MSATVPWLLLLYQLPARPSTQRVYAWRRLKTCGALYLQNSVCLLPDRDGTREQLVELEGEIISRKGEARILAVRFAAAADDEAMKALFRKQSEEEYVELLGKCRDFHEELKRERAEKHFTFAELEENEEELAKIEAWLVKIHQRDFFNAPSREKAASAIAKCQKDLSRYRLEVADAQGVRKSSSASKPAKRRAKSRE